MWRQSREAKWGGIGLDMVGRDQRGSSYMAMVRHGLGAGRGSGDGQEQEGNHGSSGGAVGNTGTRAVEALEGGAAGWQSPGGCTREW